MHEFIDLYELFYFCTLFKCINFSQIILNNDINNNIINFPSKKI